jgi:hypothetical protein
VPIFGVADGLKLRRVPSIPDHSMRSTFFEKATEIVTMFKMIGR